jgi:hypothetical protein
MQEKDGGYLFTSPATTNFSYTILPPDKSGTADLTGWLTGTARKDLQVSGFSVLPGQMKSQDVKSYKICTAIAKDAGGRQWAVYYMAYSRPDHSIRYARIVQLPDGSEKQYMNTAVAHFVQLSRREGGAPGNGATGTVGSGARGGTTGSTGSNGVVKNGTTPVTAPGQGLKAAAIRGVVIHRETAIGVGGMMTFKFNSYLLLQDGSLYSHPEVSPYDLDIARSRQEEPLKWGTWKLDGKTLLVMYGRDSKPSQWGSGWFWARPAEKNEKITGSFYTISGGGNTAMGGGVVTVSSNSFTFNDKGQFTRLNTGGGTSSGVGGTVTAYSNKDAAGTYLSDGYSIELHYNNGTVVRQSFYFYPDTKTIFGIGNRVYTPN